MPELTRTFPFCPNFEVVAERPKRAKEIKNLLESAPTLRGKYYLETIFEIYGITDENPRPQLAMEHLKKGVQLERCFACAATLLNTHIEPDKYNGGLPDYDCEAAFSYLVEVVMHVGIFDYCDYGVTCCLFQVKSMKLLQFACFCLDTSMVLREYLVKM